ncbi:MAG: hypothetical protein KJ911_13540 [Alphaproteobacteria bacterium]|jgi:hypothetical protein|uniref:hypothetical protein n=1 Tax=Brevundimonas sp. TaxID=1871086 RepID=UPI0025BE9F8E|nr:hypothetical protein [Brevundimonas sp.]MBU4197758.1 hypothetical protein [Alphaproteobacteria bacterium]MCG2662650.1 hypothetical protein [Brevundimonas sp.]
MKNILSESYGRELAARTTFEREAIWLPLLSVQLMNAGEPVVRNKTFTDCVIEGPAMITPLGGTTFESCHMGSASDPQSLLFTPRGPTLVGVIGLENCAFIRCRMVQIGYTGNPEFLADMTKLLANAKVVG